MQHYGFKYLTMLHVWRKLDKNGTPYMSKTNIANLT